MRTPAIILALVFVADVWAVGSVDFNGTTSEATNDTADVLNSTTQVTVCAWIYADGQGEGGFGKILAIDDDNAGAAWELGHHNAGHTLRIVKGAGGAGTAGVWTFPCADVGWRAVSVTHDFSTDAAPVARVDFAGVTVTQATGPSGIQDLPAAGYCIGNRDAATATWDGRISRVQVFNAILSTTDQDRALRSPGSVTSNLRLYVRLTAATDLADQSGNGFDATGANLADGADGPGVYFLNKFMALQ